MNKLFLKDDLNRRVFNLLEDFTVVGNILQIALIPNNKHNDEFRQNIQAAITANTMGLSSIDYAKKRYVDTDIADISEKNSYQLYIQSYKASKKYIENLIDTLETKNRPEPTNGVFGASIVLERLRYSFFCAHLMYELGYRYEGHAVSRLILEQIAWANQAYSLDDINLIAKIKTTKAISYLKKTVLISGPLYGFLSDKTHIDYRNHFEFLSNENKKNVINYTHHKYYEYAQVILYLADLFGIVWELSQQDFVLTFDAVTETENGFCVNKNRSFLNVSSDLCNQFENLKVES